jgi:anti-sigma B factor antagonist
MPLHPNRPWLEVEQVGAVTVVRPTRADLLDEMVINTMGSQLYSLVDELDCRRIVLDMGRVKRLASGMLGKIIGLHKKLQAAGGRLALCKVAQPLVEAFETLRLNRLFGIHGEEQEALQSLQ